MLVNTMTMKKTNRFSKTVPCSKCRGSGEVLSDAYIGQQMRNLREKLGVKLREVAKALDVSAPYISDLERGFRHWNDDLKKRFLVALGK